MACKLRASCNIPHERHRRDLHAAAVKAAYFLVGLVCFCGRDHTWHCLALKATLA